MSWKSRGITQALSLVLVLGIATLCQASSLDTFKKSLSDISKAGDTHRLDSLVSAERFDTYKFLQSQLEEYFDIGDEQLWGLLDKLAVAVEKQYADPFYRRQTAQYRQWRQKEMSNRQSLKQSLVQLSPADTSSGQWDDLIRAFSKLGDTATTVKVLQMKGLALQSADAGNQSLQAFTKAIELSRSVGDIDGLARSYNLMGSYYQRIGSYLKAGDYFDSSRVLRTQLGDKRGQAECLNNIAAVYLALDDMKEGYRFSQEALRLRRDLGDTALICQSLLNMISAFRRDRPSGEIDNWLQEAQQLAATLNDPQLTVRLLQAAGIAAEAAGAEDSALSRYSQALTEVKDINQPRMVISLLLNLASAANSSGDYATALEHYLQAKEIAEKTDNRTALANILHNLGTVYQRLGDQGNALLYYQKSLNEKKKLNLPGEMIETLNNLGEMYVSANDLTTASDYLNQSLKIARTFGNQRLYATTLISLARLKQQENDYFASASLLDSALAIYATLGIKQGTFDIHIMKADYARQRRDWKRSEQELSIASEIVADFGSYANIQKHDLIAGLLWFDEQKLDSAYSYLTRVVARLESVRRNIPDAELRGFQKSETRFIYEKVVSLLLVQFTATQNRSLLDSLLQYVELAKSRSLLDMLYESHLRLSQKVSPSMVKEEQSQQRSIEQIEQLIMESTDEKERLSGSRKLADLTTALNELRLHENLVDSNSSRLFYPNRSALRNLPSRLFDAHTAILDYLLMPDRSILLVVDNHQTRYYVLPDRLQISNQLIHYQYLLQNSVKNETLLDSLRIASRELATATLGDFQKEVGNYSSLYISADGVLSLLPFESLLLGDKYLIETAEIANVPSLYLLPTLRERLQTDTLSLLAFADPKPENSLQPLPFSLKEVQWISALFKGEQCKLLTGAAAAKSFLFSPEASRFNLLHFATHSSIDHDDPLRSRTWLSPDTSGDSTNYLTLDDVMRLSLSADLVVLSSCESGGGRYQLGEGIEGFVRAFMYAGCRNVVVSLWDVEDFTSATFMKTFYQNLNHGYVSALRQAKLEMIKSPRLRYRHPYYWAPFVLVLGQ